MHTRRERDTLGEVEVPAGALYGAQTQRAVENYPISGQLPHPDFVWAAALVKKGAALANMRTGRLEHRLGDAIVSAADEVLTGRWQEQFVVDRFQAGAGTSHNMNANEVLANRANELLGGARGEYRPVPNDAVPAMVRLAALRGGIALDESLAQLEEAFGAKEREFSGLIKTGRTHLQDAVPLRLGDEMGAYRVTIAKARAALEAAADDLRALNLGATAVGTGTNADVGYRVEIVAVLRELTGWDLRPPRSYYQVTQSYDDFVRFSGALRGLAVELAKIAHDLRLLSSGPRAGLGELVLPPVQPGSSIMPGKVNPALAEMLDMVTFRVIGNDTTAALAGMSGQLDLNVFAPVMADCLLTSLTILTSSTRVFAERCVRGITAVPERLAALLARNTALATALAPSIGYARAAEVAKRAVAADLTIREAALAEGVLDQQTLDRLLALEPMVEPGVPGDRSV